MFLNSFNKFFLVCPLILTSTLVYGKCENLDTDLYQHGFANDLTSPLPGIDKNQFLDFKKYKDDLIKAGNSLIAAMKPSDKCPKPRLVFESYAGRTLFFCFDEAEGKKRREVLKERINNLRKSDSLEALRKIEGLKRESSDIELSFSGFHPIGDELIEAYRSFSGHFYNYNSRLEKKSQRSAEYDQTNANNLRAALESLPNRVVEFSKTPSKDSSDAAWAKLEDLRLKQELVYSELEDLKKLKDIQSILQTPELKKEFTAQDIRALSKQQKKLEQKLAGKGKTELEAKAKETGAEIVITENLLKNYGRFSSKFQVFMKDSIVTDYQYEDNERAPVGISCEESNSTPNGLSVGQNTPGLSR